jgi:hypothetical protein
MSDKADRDEAAAKSGGTSRTGHCKLAVALHCLAFSLRDSLPGTEKSRLNVVLGGKPETQGYSAPGGRRARNLHYLFLRFGDFFRNLVGFST